MKQHRIDYPADINPIEIAARIADGYRVIVQHQQLGYDLQHLERLNNLAAVHGSSLEVRFYSHYLDVFDASIIQFLPDVVSLSLDCLKRARNLETLALLTKLKNLCIGVFELEEGEILDACPSAVESLVLGDTRKSNINLAHLSRFASLHTFHTTGHSKGISSLCSIPSLRKLSLSSIRKNVNLDFVSYIPGVTFLRLILGGRESIVSLEARHLRVLEIIRVLGLQDLGNMGRFEKLEQVLVQDQKQLKQICFGQNRSLREIDVINCKQLEKITSIAQLRSVERIRVVNTCLDYADFIASEMPPSLKTLVFYTGKRKHDAEIRVDLATRGFEEKASWGHLSL